MEVERSATQGRELKSTRGIMDVLVELFSFQGRANRQRYFWHVVLDDLFIISMFVAIVLVSSSLVLPFVGLCMGAVVAALAITVKRLHDLGRPGWHLLGFMIPLYNVFLGFQLVFQKGTDGPNAYGPDPLRAYRQIQEDQDTYFLTES